MRPIVDARRRKVRHMTLVKWIVGAGIFAAGIGLGTSLDQVTPEAQAKPKIGRAPAGKINPLSDCPKGFVKKQSGSMYSCTSEIVRCKKGLSMTAPTYVSNKKKFVYGCYDPPK